MNKIKKALISVFDKEGIVEFGKELDSLGIEIISTGGTAKALKDSGVKVRDVSDHTNFPEMMDGRVKTLHPKVLGGLLALRNNEKHMQEAKDNQIEMIDLVVVNLYPFEETVKKNLGFEETIEMIDIGGPSMIRAASKNFKDVLVVIDPKDYSWIVEELKAGKDITVEKRKELARKVFEKTAEYDALITDYMNDEQNLLPQRRIIPYRKKQAMRYGENPYQDAAYYDDPLSDEPGVGDAEQLNGKELSYNNIMDTDGALEIVREFAGPCAAVIKHANPSGVSVSEKIEDALEKAYNADSLSAFGCVIALNRACNKKCAEFLNDKFIEVVIAPDFDEEALEILKSKKNLRLLKLDSLKCLGTCKKEALTTKKVVGGLLVQTRNFPRLNLDEVKIVKNLNPSKEDIDKLTQEAKEDKLKELICVTEKEPTKEQLKDMVFAMKVCRHVKSNSVLYANDLVTIGIGAGQMSRVDSTIIATRKSKGKAKGAVMVSDAFFPFRDGIDEAAKAGVKAIIHPGGSIRDKEVIDAANEHGIVMVFSGVRLFKH